MQVLLLLLADMPPAASFESNKQQLVHDATCDGLLGVLC